MSARGRSRHVDETSRTESHRKLRWLLPIAALGALLVGGCGGPDDAAISADVRQELALARVPGRIEVATANGVVTLSGMVPNAAIRAQAEHRAGNVDSVELVVNRLQTPSESAPPIAPRQGLPGVPNPAQK